MKAKKWKKLSSRTLSKKAFRNDFLEMKVDKVKLPNNKIIDYVYTKRLTDGIMVVPVLGNKIILVRQYRYLPGDFLWELPAGEHKKGESPQKSAERELLEETGYSTNNVRKIFTYYTSQGDSTQKIHLFLATGLKKGKKQLEDTEFIQTRAVGLNTALKWVLTNKIKSHDALGILLAHYYLKNSHR